MVAQTIKNLLAVQEIQVQSLYQERSPGEGNGNLLQYSVDRGTWQTTVHGVTSSRTQLSK